MIRIDEIYNNYLWEWIRKHKPHLRIFYCDPFGSSDANSLHGHDNGTRRLDTNYVFFFDQEPICLDLHTTTFDKLKNVLNGDIHSEHWHQHGRGVKKPRQLGFLVTSEKNSEYVDTVCQRYGWKSYYYFFHGWAALDWYRGYNRSSLMLDPQYRIINRTFIMPNRIIGGMRQHRLIILYHIFKNCMTNNWISCPDVCPAENKTVEECIEPLKAIYPDIAEVFGQQQFPIAFPNESGAPMHSCWLSLFDESAECLLYLVTETVATGQRLHLTEKSFKPICLKMPFIIVGTCGSLKYLRSYGFKTFSDLWDESYDDEQDDSKRLERVADLLCKLDKLSTSDKQNLFNMAQEIVEHNFNHFYNGGFEKLLWQEFTSMMKGIDV